MSTDPFASHPELRDQIADPLTSTLRTITTEAIARMAGEHGLPSGWWYSDEDREARRARVLAGRHGADLWVFAYGSLMWDPAIRFADVRRAFVPGYARRFILKDVYGARGNARSPGLMAALDVGGGCDGLAFRIAAKDVGTETEILWRREQVGPAYTATFVQTEIGGATVDALTFVADHEAEIIHPDITRDEQIRYLATGVGFMGTSMDYLRGVAAKLRALEIRDLDVTSLLGDAEAYAAAVGDGG